MNPIKRAVTAVGGIAAAAKLCGVSSRAVNKWIAAGRLPRTEYTGETRHAENLANGSRDSFTAAWLRDASLSHPIPADGTNSNTSRTYGSAPEVPVNPSSMEAA